MINKEVINNIDFHIYKTNRYKKTKVEITFRKRLEKEKLSIYAFMLGMMNECSLNLKTRRQKTIRSEELYNARTGAWLSKKGMSYKIFFELEFINIEYINEKDYLKDVLKHLYEMLFNPDFDNETIFDMVKTNLILDREGSKEFQNSLAYENALNTMDKNSITSLCDIGEVEDIKKVSIDDLKEAYNSMINDSKVDVFIMGNTDVNKIKDEFNNIFKLQSKDLDIDVYIENKEKDTPLYKEDPSTFDQTVLEIIYNLNNLTDREINLVFPMFNFIFGNGGLTSKLYKYVREENSLCYGIGANHMKYDKLLVISSSLKKSNVDKAIECINKALSEMIEGVFSDDDIKDALSNLETSLKLQMKDPVSIYYHYQLEVFYKAHDFNYYLNGLKTVTKKEIMDVAKKLKINTTYILCEDENGNN